MSAEVVKAFFDKVRADAALAQKVKSILTVDGDAAVAELVKLAAEEGFDFTAQDYQTALEKEKVEEPEADVVGQTCYVENPCYVEDPCYVNR